MRHIRLGFLAVALLFAGRSALARDDLAAQSRFFTTSDGVRLHYLEAGPPTAHVIVFVPGWTMPAWIWGPQIEALAGRYHVVAFDPRGQGDSEVAATGYEPQRRGEDIAELIGHLGPAPVLVRGWCWLITLWARSLRLFRCARASLVRGCRIRSTWSGSFGLCSCTRPGRPISNG